MKRFLMKFSVLLLLFGAVNALLLFAIPADGNQYLQAYNRKLSLLEQLNVALIQAAERAE